MVGSRASVSFDSLIAVRESKFPTRLNESGLLQALALRDLPVAVELPYLFPQIRIVEVRFGDAPQRVPRSNYIDGVLGSHRWLVLLALIAFVQLALYRPDRSVRSPSDARF
jgi:hypothetical protein